MRRVTGPAPSPKLPPVDLGHRGLPAEGAGEEGLVGAVDVDQAEVPLEGRDAVGAAELRAPWRG